MSRSKAPHVKPAGQKPSNKKVSKFRGVSWHKGNKRWRATIHVATQGPKHVGYFDDEEEAAKARDVAVMKLRTKTKLNFPAHTYFKEMEDPEELTSSTHATGVQIYSNEHMGFPLAHDNGMDLDISLNMLINC